MNSPTGQSEIQIKWIIVLKLELIIVFGEDTLSLMNQNQHSIQTSTRKYNTNIYPKKNIPNKIYFFNYLAMYNIPRSNNPLNFQSNHFVMTTFTNTAVRMQMNNNTPHKLCM